MVPGAGIEPARLAAGDFESPASTNFTTRAAGSEALNYGTVWAMKYPTIEDAIGKTPLVALQRIGASDNAARGVFGGGDALQRDQRCFADRVFDGWKVHGPHCAIICGFASCSPGGEIGRRRGLKIPRRKACRFDSGPGHHEDHNFSVKCLLKCSAR